MLLAAPIAAVTAAGLWKPRPKYYLERKWFSPEEIHEIYGGARGGGKTEFQMVITGIDEDRGVITIES